MIGKLVLDINSRSAKDQWARIRTALERKWPEPTNEEIGEFIRQNIWWVSSAEEIRNED